MVKYVIIFIILMLLLKRLTRKKGVDDMLSRPYRHEMDSRKSSSGWKGGF